MRGVSLQAVVLAVLVLGGDGTWTDAWAQGRTTASAPVLWRGMFLDVPTASATFAPCGDRTRYRVLDETPERDLWRIYRDLSHDRAQRIYVEFIAQRRGSRLEVLELRRAVAEGLGCSEDLTDIEVKAVGSDPFWRLQVERTGIRFERPGAEDWTVFPSVAFAQHDGARQLETTAHGATLSVRITPRRCHDTIGDMVFAFEALVTLNGTEYRGCAYEGDAAR